MRWQAPLLLLLLLLASATAQTTDRSALTLAAEVEAIAKGQELWPGFEPLKIPLAVYDGSSTYLFRHPDPPPEFQREPDFAIHSGRHPAMTANTSIEIGGVLTATILLDQLQTDGTLLDLAATAIHESFHVFQSEHHVDWYGNVIDLFTYPSANGELLAQRRLETEALRRAMVEESVTDRACWAGVALHIRQDRFAALDSIHAAYERGLELNEGLATYVEKRVHGTKDSGIPPEGYSAEGIRQRGYDVGLAWALLLDDFAPGWQDRLEKDDDQFLDVLLHEALPAPASADCEFTADEVAEQEQRARDDAARLLDRQQQYRTDFEAAPGWSLVIEAAAGRPFWPQRFDPSNMHIVTGGVLHTRFIRLGNECGSLELIDRQVLTESAGDHPLFDGITRVVLTGLPGRPELAVQGDEITLELAGCSASFKPATLSQREQVVVVTLQTSE
ncbi:MAG: hypothetical protein ABIF77_21825 [bacterium]